MSGWLSRVMTQAATGGTVTVDRGDARISLVHVDDVAEQLARLATIDAGVFTDRHFFNTGGDATTMRELAALVQEIVPQARIEVTSSGEAGVRTHIDALRART